MGDKGNSRGARNRGLVNYYEDGDGNGNGNYSCLRGKGGWTRGVGGGIEGWVCFYSLFSFLMEGRKIVSCCLILLLFFCLSLFNAMQVD